MHEIYTDGEWSIYRQNKRIYEIWLWLPESEEWCYMGKTRSKVSAIREIDNMKGGE